MYFTRKTVFVLIPAHFFFLCCFTFFVLISWQRTPALFVKPKTPISLWFHSVNHIVPVHHIWRPVWVHRHHIQIKIKLITSLTGATSWNFTMTPHHQRLSYFTNAHLLWFIKIAQLLVITHHSIPTFYLITCFSHNKSYIIFACSYSCEPLLFWKTPVGAF